MRRLNISTVILVTAVVIGCGPGKELPDAAVQPKQITGPTIDPNVTAPTASEPEAKAVLDRALKAISVNDLGRLAKAKIVKATYQAEVHRQGPREPMTKMASTIETVWPEFAFVKEDYRDFVVTFTLRSPQGWQKTGLNISPMPPLEVGRVMRGDLTAWHWMMFGLPLSDPKTVAFSSTKTPTGTSVKIAVPDLPVYLVTFDNTSGLPVRIEYAPIEMGQRVSKIFTMSEHTASSGLMLPTKIELTQGDAVGMRWLQPTWEFPESIDPSHFEQPK